MNWFESIKKWYDSGYWTEEMVENAYLKDKISLLEKNNILGEK